MPEIETFTRVYGYYQFSQGLALGGQNLQDGLPFSVFVFNTNRDDKLTEFVGVSPGQATALRARLLVADVPAFSPPEELDRDSDDGVPFVRDEFAGKGLNLCLSLFLRLLHGELRQNEIAATGKSQMFWLDIFR